MVVWWTEQRIKGIKILKYRIRHHEQHGNGKVAMDEKFQLQKMEKHHKDKLDEAKNK